MSRWIVVHEIGAPSHYSALRYALQQRGIDLVFAEFNFYSQLKAIVRRRPGQWNKTRANLCCFARFIVSGARGWNVVLGIAPYNPWLVVVRWLLRHAQVNLHSSWPHWDGTRHPHPPLLPGVLAAWQRFLTRDVRGVLIATELARANLSRSRFGGAATTVVAHSYDPACFRVGNQVPTPPCRMIFIGRLEVTKGVDLMLEIARRRPQLELVLIGGGPLRRTVEEATASVTNVRYLGEIRDRHRLANEMRASQVLLLPSIRVDTWEELFGMVLIEGMACGLVPLATDHVGPTEILGPGLKELLLTEAGFVEGVCQRIDQWRADLSQFVALRERCLSLAEPYAVDRIAKRWATALDLAGVDRAGTPQPTAP